MSGKRIVNYPFWAYPISCIVENDFFGSPKEKQLQLTGEVGKFIGFDVKLSQDFIHQHQQEVQLPQRDCTTCYVSKFLVCFTRYPLLAKSTARNVRCILCSYFGCICGSNTFGGEAVTLLGLGRPAPPGVSVILTLPLTHDNCVTPMLQVYNNCINHVNLCYDHDVTCSMT